MKIPMCFAAALCGLFFVSPATAQPPASLPDDGILVIDTGKFPVPQPPPYRLRTRTVYTAGEAGVTGVIHVTVLPEKDFPARVVMGLSDGMPVAEVSGEGLVSWSVRHAAGGDDAEARRFLELVFSENGDEPVVEALEFTVVVRGEGIGGELELVLPGPGESAGFSAEVVLENSGFRQWMPVLAEGLAKTDSTNGLRYWSGGDSRLVARLARSAAAEPDVVLHGVTLRGEFDPESKAVVFDLEAQASAASDGAVLQLLSGMAALRGPASGPGWTSQAALAGGENGFSGTLLRFDRAGVVPVRLRFAAKVLERDGWSRLDFRLPSATIVKVDLSGLPREVEFLDSAQVVPLSGEAPGGAVAWLPSGGGCDIGWRTALVEGPGRLFVRSSALTDLAVGPGRITQTTRFDLRVLQGRLERLEFLLEGAGEVVQVRGTNLAAWKIEEQDGARRLVLELSRPVEKEAVVTILSDTSAADAGVAVGPLRFQPAAGDTRGVGLVRIRNDGAMRFDVIDSAGLIQISPEEWTGGEAPDETRQVQVYRFPDTAYDLRIAARQVFPEVAVNQVTVYEAGVSDRVIHARIELDVREAPLRDWNIGIPEEFAVVSLSGTGVADHETSGVPGGGRDLRVLFSPPVEGRALLELRLEKSHALPADHAEDWDLPALRFPGARSVRGFIGFAATPGYRAVAVPGTGLAETPLAFFPGQVDGLQLAFRQREAEWALGVNIEPLSRSIAADAFHLVLLREGMAYVTTVLNFFVVGSPANEWEVEIPEAAGNVMIDGQDIRTWRVENGRALVSLNRPAIGASTLLVTFEIPLPPGGSRIAAGGVRPLGVASERGFVQVVSPSQVDMKVTATEGLMRIEPGELPPELRLLTAAPTLAAFQYSSRPILLDLDVAWFEGVESVPQVVDFAKLQTRVSADGQVVTDARYFVKTRGVGALRMTLPQNATIWEARVDGQVVNPRSEDGNILLPLPASADLDQAVEVELRFGVASWFPWRIGLHAPRIAAPVLATEWHATADAGRVLVPRASNSVSADRVLAPTGFARLSEGPSGLFFWLMVAGAGVVVFILRRGDGTGRPAAIAALISAIACGVAGALLSLGMPGGGQAGLNLSGAIASDGEALGISVWNLPSALAGLSVPGLMLCVAGVVLLAIWMLRVVSSVRIAAVAGWGAMAAGLLLQHGGGAWFFAWAVIGLIAAFRRPVLAIRPRSDGLAGAAASWVLLGLVICGASAQDVRPGDVPPAGFASLEQTILHEPAGIEAEVAYTLRVERGDAVLLLRPPGILLEFHGEGVRLNKVEPAEGGQPSYFVVAEREGLVAGTFRYTMVLPPGKRDIELPTGPAAVTELHVEGREPGWAFSSPSAVAEEHAGSETGGAAKLILAPSDPQILRVSPLARDPAREKMMFFAESSQLFIPRAGAVRCVADFRFRVARGELRELEIGMPEGAVVERITSAMFPEEQLEWRFDPDGGRLRIALPSAQRGDFGIRVASQLPLGPLPSQTILTPARVASAADESGQLAVAFPSDTRAESVSQEGLLAINLEDFDPGFLKENADGATLYRVWRFSREDAGLTMNVAAVDPEIRATLAQVLSLGEERASLSVDLSADIRRSGVFRIMLEIPHQFEVESVSGDAFSHWSEEVQGGVRTVTLHFPNPTIGVQAFAFNFSAPPVAGEKEWEVPRARVSAASRTEGTLLVVPARGMRMQVVERAACTPIDSTEAAAMQPGALAFRVLQADWRLVLDVDLLEPWVTAQALHQVRLREGQAAHRVALRYRVENAPVRSLRFTLPGLDGEALESVRVDGEAVADAVPLEDGSGQWEIRFRRGMLGDVPLHVEYQQSVAAGEHHWVFHPIRLEGVRQAALFGAVRAGGRLDFSEAPLPATWQRVEWTTIPGVLTAAADPDIPPLAFRVGDPSLELSLQLRGVELADALKLRVAEGRFSTFFSPRGASATSAKLKVSVNQEASMMLRLPAGAGLFQVMVNGEEVVAARDGDELRFYVTAPPRENELAVVEFSYVVAGGRGGRREVAIQAPGFSVPLESVRWEVLLPKGWELTGHSGPLALEATVVDEGFSLDDYLARVSAKRVMQAETADRLLSEAGRFLREGDADRARAALNVAARAPGVDEATNEDARVQLRNLASQQAVLGLNTLRQKIYLDNRAAEGSPINEQLEQAARANPILQGREEFDFGGMDRLMEGISLEEAGALRRVAERIVGQQLAAEATPGSLGILLPERTSSAVFTRSVQVDGASPLEVRIGIRRTDGLRWGASSALLLGVVLLSGMIFFGGKRPE